MDKRFFGYALMKFFDLPCNRQKKQFLFIIVHEMLERNHLSDLLYPIAL